MLYIVTDITGPVYIFSVCVRTSFNVIIINDVVSYCKGNPAHIPATNINQLFVIVTSIQGQAPKPLFVP
jgi:hypothetical protein